MYIIKDDWVIGIIPARGGSKSIQLKNLAKVAGVPLINYVIDSGKRSTALKELYCSTDHEAIKEYCYGKGVHVINRPNELAQDNSPVTDTIEHVLSTIMNRVGCIPEIVVLLQPTSPFVLPSHIDRCIETLRMKNDVDSVQTITSVFHNAHALNQRTIYNGFVSFRFNEERRIAYNKQLKQKLYLFGNLVVTKSRSLIKYKDCFGVKSIPIEIPRVYALDIDTNEDLDYATYLIMQKKVELASTET